MNRFLIPLLLAVNVIFLLSLQCTLSQRFVSGGVHLELLPPLLLYAAFTVNLPTSLMLGALSAVMYDSFSAQTFGASMIPYITGMAIFCAIRPIFFRNQLTTQLLSGIIFALMVLGLQWMFSGKVMIGWDIVARKIVRLSLWSGVLSVIYFTLLDACFRMVGLEPGRFDEG